MPQEFAVVVVHAHGEGHVARGFDFGAHVLNGAFVPHIMRWPMHPDAAANRRRGHGWVFASTRLHGL